MSGPRFLVGTFEDGGNYVAHLNVQDTFNRKEPIGLVWRLEALVPTYLLYVPTFRFLRRLCPLSDVGAA